MYVVQSHDQQSCVELRKGLTVGRSGGCYPHNEPPIVQFDERIEQQTVAVDELIGCYLSQGAGGTFRRQRCGCRVVLHTGPELPDVRRA